jgi:hypothetical protein
MVVDETDSTYAVEYTTFKSFTNTIYADLLSRGGVAATYYSGAGLTAPVKATEITAATNKIQFKGSAVANGDYSIPSVGSFSAR